MGDYRRAQARRAGDHRRPAEDPSRHDGSACRSRLHRRRRQATLKPAAEHELMSRFFIDRPIFAWVLGLVLMLAGAIEIYLLPVAQFPSIAPPQVSITVTYPGASAQTVQDT